MSIDVVTVEEDIITVSESDETITVEETVTTDNPLPNFLPVGGTTGQVLKKVSNDDYDVEWDDESGGGGGSSTTAKKIDRLITALEISNGYITLAHLIEAETFHFSVRGIIQYDTSEAPTYALSTVGGVTRVTLLGALAAAGAYPLTDTEYIHFSYRY